ncbi:MAG: AI-2E family transporter [Planctomycetales bacterium]|nr:AI-2E family transporter [Planctomycetales bacterium]
MTRVASLVVLLAIIVATSILFWKVMSSFFVPLFLSLLLVVMFRPVYEWLLTRLQRPRLAASLTVSLITLLVLLPCVWIVTMAISQGVTLFTHTDVSTFQSRLERLRGSLKLDLPESYHAFRAAAHKLERLSGLEQLTATADHQRELESIYDQLREVREQFREEGALASFESLELALAQLEYALQQPAGSLAQSAALDNSWGSVQTFRIQHLGGPVWAWVKETVNPTDAQLQSLQRAGFGYLRQWLLTLSGNTLALGGQMLLGGVIVVISLYFFLLDGPAMTKTVMWLSPLDDRHEEELLSEFAKVSRAVVIATLLSAIVQGMLASVGFWIVGLPAVMLMLLTTVFAMVPFFGAAAVWVPASIYLYLVEARMGAAIGLATYGALIISTSDNVIKPWVLHGQSNLHPLFALLSVLGGVQTLGAMGILVGPMVVAFMQTLLKILHRELSALDARESEHVRGGATEAAEG